MTMPYRHALKMPRHRYRHVSDGEGRHTELGRPLTLPVRRHRCYHRRHLLMTPRHPLSHAALTSFLRRCHHVGLSTNTAFHPVHLYWAPVDTRPCPATHTTAVYRSCHPRPIDSLTYDRAVASIAHCFVRSSVSMYCDLLCQDDVWCMQLVYPTIVTIHVVGIASIFWLGSWLVDLKLVTQTMAYLVGSNGPWSPQAG